MPETEVPITSPLSQAPSVLSEYEEAYVSYLEAAEGGDLEERLGTSIRLRSMNVRIVAAALTRQAAEIRAGFTDDGRDPFGVLTGSSPPHSHH